MRGHSGDGCADASWKHNNISWATLYGMKKNFKEDRTANKRTPTQPAPARARQTRPGTPPPTNTLTSHASATRHSIHTVSIRSVPLSQAEMGVFFCTRCWGGILYEVVSGRIRCVSEAYQRCVSDTDTHLIRTWRERIGRSDDLRSVSERSGAITSKFNPIRTFDARRNHEPDIHSIHSKRQPDATISFKP